jgi:hypothetical protein
VIGKRGDADALLVHDRPGGRTNSWPRATASTDAT